MIENHFYGFVGVVTQADSGDKVRPTTVKTSEEFRAEMEKMAAFEHKSMSKLIRDALHFYKAFGKEDGDYDPFDDVRIKMLMKRDDIIEFAERYL